MAWRFKASKYKNATPLVPKPEACIRDIFVGSYQTYGNNIAASAAFMAFNVEHNGSSLAVLPIDDCGRKCKTMPLLHAHTDTVTDMDFSPFNDGLLATGSSDCFVKLWHIPPNGLEQSLSDAQCTFYHKQRRVEAVRFHPTADWLLTSTSFTTLTLWDINAEKELLANQEHTDVIQSLSWKKDGTLLATSCKDKQIRIVDLRCKPDSSALVYSGNSHQSIKDSRVVWLGDQNKIISTGFDMSRQREVFIRDLRNFEETEKCLTLDSSTGILMALYDSDTGMLFLAGKGDTTISYLEVSDREPYLIEGIRHNGEQTKGACLVPKRALNVMQGEVNRLLQLTSSSVIPITYQVPRKSYREFHTDLFPETCGTHTQLSAVDWLSGRDIAVPLISLDPSKQQQSSLQPRLGPQPFVAPNLSSSILPATTTTITSVPANGTSTLETFKPSMTTSPVQQKKDLSELTLTPVQSPTSDEVDEDSIEQEECKTPTTAQRRKLFESALNNDDNEEENNGSMTIMDEDKLEEFERASMQRSSIAERRRLYENRSMSVQDSNRDNVLKMSPLKEQKKDRDVVPVPMLRQLSLEQAVPTPTPKRTSTVFGRVSKFRHLKGTPLHKSSHIENIRNVSRQVSGECDGFYANSQRVAVPLEGPGGKIAIFELNKTGKLPDGVIPTLVHGTNVMDFAWDPFNPQRLAVGCDDGIIRLWLIPESGLTEPTNNPTHELAGGHSEKIYSIKFHPLASDVLASAGYDFTIRIWDLNLLTEKLLLNGHTDQIFSMCWSPCGSMLATVCRDSKLRVYNPRSNPNEPIKEGKGPAGSRGARIVWAIDGKFLVVLGFDKVSERQIQVFYSNDLTAPLNTVGLDVSPAILIPFYDEDSSTLFLTGKGDSTIYAYEVTDEAPYLCALSHHRCQTLHQGLSFLPKNVCDVSSVEFARALRLTNNVIEPLAFTVPRIKSELFQDDLFPPTKVSWEAVMTSTQWFQGENKQPRRISLQPDGMDTLSTMGQVGIGSGDKLTTNKAVFQGAQQPFNRLGWNSDMSGATKEKQQQIQQSVSNRMQVNLSLEQDRMEGVDETEWDE